MDDLLIRMFDKYDIEEECREEIYPIIKDIYESSYFKERLTDKFYHHGTVTLGEHILEDMLKTYLLAKLYKFKHPRKKLNIRLAVIIAMIHDLYVMPWQNNKEASVKKFKNFHGFRHPIEAVIDAYTWYPELFNSKDDARIIIDGVIHHMYPLPVVSLKNGESNDCELKNYQLFLDMDDDIKKLLIKSTNRHVLLNFSFAKSKYLEGRIMAKADKLVSVKQLDSIYDYISLVNAKNKRLKK